MAGDDLKIFKVLKDGNFGSIKMIKPGISQVWMIVDNSVVCMLTRRFQGLFCSLLVFATRYSSR